MKEDGVKQFVFMSSMIVYGGLYIGVIQEFSLHRIVWKHLYLKLYSKLYERQENT